MKELKMQNIMLRVIVVVLALLFISVASPKQGFAADTVLPDPVASFYLTCMTRSGVTTESDMASLRPVAYRAARQFQLNVSEFVSVGKFLSFRKGVGQLVNTYAKEYALAAAGAAGSDDRAAAFDRLLSGLLSVASNAGISSENLDMAALCGAAAAETALVQYPQSSTLSLQARELVKLLLRVSIDQIHRRTVLTESVNALSLVQAPTELVNRYASFTSALEPGLTAELVGIEQFLSDPLNVADDQKLVTEQFNNDARCDIFAMKYGMQLLFSSNGLDAIVSEFAARMPGMTPEQLKAFGVISDMPPLTAIAAYNFVTPELQLSYTPVAGLSEKLASLGQTPPQTPDFSPFANPYLALFQLQYDIKLCDLITSAERTIAEDAAFNLSRPLSLGERLSLKQAAVARLSQVWAQASGIPEDAASSLVLLLQSAQGIRM